MSSYNKFHNNFLRDSIFLTFLCEGTSVYGGFAIFAVLGYMAHEAGVTVDKVVSSGPGLAFIVYPEAISMMPLPQLWAVLFFIMIITVFLDSQFTDMEIILTALCDYFPRQLMRHRTLLTALYCVVIFLTALCFVTQGGVYVFQLVDWFIATLTVTTISLMECLVLGWIYVSPRILSARFNSKGRKVTILQCYAPTNRADEEEKENFYEQLQAVLDKAPRRDLKILMGDLNAKVGTDNTDRELIMGKHGTGTKNENGELFTEFCTTNDLVIGGTIFPHKTIHKTTWTSPDGRTVNQIDHITIGRKWRRSLLDVRAKRGADAASDHHLVIAAIKIKLKAYRDQADRPSHKYNVHSLKESVKTNAFRCELRNRFSALDTLLEETIEEHWHDLRETWTATCREVLGKKTRQHKEWLTSDTWDLITERKRLKDLINHTDDQDDKRDLQAQYWDVNRQVKRSARNDKRNFINDLTEEAETAAGQRNMKRLYEITRTLSGKNNNPTRPVKDKNGQIITKEEDQRTSLAKQQAPDGIPPEALKADIQTSTDMLHPLLRKIWESESVPQDWKKGHLVKLPKKGDLSSCSNWRGIMLLSIPGKVLTRIILERLKTALDKTLREEQAGFRNDRSCTDHIATMRIIIEQSLEWQTPLYSTFVDFQKAFDSVDREVI
nr:hypothetical protein BaRGS_027976 [Batillaria attramentaria]